MMIQKALFQFATLIAASAQMLAIITALLVFLSGFVAFFTEVGAFGFTVRLGWLGAAFWAVFGAMLSVLIATLVRLPIILLGSLFAFVSGTWTAYWHFVQSINKG